MNKTYNFPYLPIIDSADEARDLAIAWQAWMSERNLSIGELSAWSSYFEKLAKRFNLKDEFQENGII